MTDTVFGKFTRTKLLGQGGMGEVWKAWDGQLGRWVALKFLKGESPELMARFQREAQIASRLTHPNIAAIYEVGPNFIAMQFVEGTTLKPGKHAAKLISVAARAVHFAHEQGIVHRDIKPDNLMVTAEGHLFVMDFGLARPTEGKSDISQSGMLVGTPQYMPPEQAKGERVDARADVYSLGATLYELLLRRPPFAGQNVLDLLAKVVNDEPPPPKGLDPDLQTILLKCLEKERDRRYGTAAGLADDLDRFLAGEPIAARAPSQSYRLKKFYRRRRVPILLAGVAVIVLGVALGVVLPGLWKESAARKKGEKELTLEKEKAGALNELGAMWAQVLLARQGLYKEKEDPRRVAVAIREAVEKVGGYIGRYPNQPQGYYIRGRGWLYLGDLTRAEEDLEKAIRLDESFSPGHLLLGRVLFERYNEGMYQSYKGTKGRAQARMLPVLKRVEREIGKVKEDEPDSKWGLNQVAEDRVTKILMRSCIAAYVEKDWPRAKSILVEENGRKPSEEYCRMMGSMGADPNERLAWLTRAVEIRPHYAEAYLDRGNIRQQTGDFSSAIADYTRAIEEDPECWLAYENRGSLLGDAGKPLEAKRDLEKAIALNPKASGPHSNLGITLLKLGKLEPSIASFTAAIDLDGENVVALSYRGFAKYQAADYAGALADFGRAIDIDPGYADGYNGRGLVREREDDYRGAQDDFTRYIELNPKSPSGYSNRGMVLMRQKRYDESLKDYDKAIEISPRNPEAYAGRAIVHGLRADLAAAEADVRTAIDLAPPHGPQRAQFEDILKKLLGQ